MPTCHSLCLTPCIPPYLPPTSGSASFEDKLGMFTYDPHVRNLPGDLTLGSVCQQRVLCAPGHACVGGLQVCDFVQAPDGPVLWTIVSVTQHHWLPECQCKLAALQAASSLMISVALCVCTFAASPSSDNVPGWVLQSRWACGELLEVSRRDARLATQQHLH
jgi:hypothetical protein